jgi:hypothetical protein
LLLAGRNRLAIGIQLLLLVPVIELYVFNGRANGPVFVFFMAMFCVTLVIAWVRDVSRIWRSGTPAPDVAISV